RVREEDHHGPHQDAHREEESRPQVRAPCASAPDLRADDGLREQAEPEQQEARREHPVDELRRRLHQRPSSEASRSSITPGATNNAKTTPARTTSSGGSTASHQKPWPCGWRSVTRYGWRNAQKTPASIVTGPSAHMKRARADSRRTAARSWTSCVLIPPPACGCSHRARGRLRVAAG